MKKKTLALLLTTALLSSLTLGNATLYAEDFASDDFFMEETDIPEEADISLSTEETESSVNIPIILDDSVEETADFAGELDFIAPIEEENLPVDEESVSEEDSDFYSQEAEPFSLAAATSVVYDADQIPFFANRTIQNVADQFSNAKEAGITYNDSNSVSWYSAQPSLKAPYAIGVITPDTHKAMTEATNFYRWLAGVDPLKTVSTNSDKLQGEAFDRNWYFDHHIPYSSKPSDMPESIWDIGYDCTHNILSSGTTPFYSINNWLNEGYCLYTDSWDTIGHRTALLDSEVSGLQFGYSDGIAVGKITGYNNYFSDRPFAAFPAPGYMPNSEVSPQYASWTVEINTNVLQNPDSSGITVKVTNLKTNNSYTCTKANGKGQFGAYYLNFVQPTDYSTGNGAVYTDNYRVEITGLLDVATGSPATIRYTVKFVDISPYVRATVQKASVGINAITLAPSFSDSTALKKVASILPKTIYVTGDNGQQTTTTTTGTWQIDTSKKCFYISATGAALPSNMKDRFGMLGRVELPYIISTDNWITFNHLIALEENLLEGDTLKFYLKRNDVWCEDSQIFRLTQKNDGNYTSTLAFDSKTLSDYDREKVTHVYSKTATREDAGEYISMYFSRSDMGSKWESDAYICTSPCNITVDHNYNNGHIKLPATYTKTGLKVCTCMGCGATKEEVIPTIPLLPAPAITSISNSTSGVLIKWNAVPGAKRYRILRKKGSGSWAKMGETTSLTFTNKSVTSGTTYSYKVLAVSADSSEIISEEPATVKTIKFLSMPELPTLTSLSTGIKVTWNAVPGAAKYRILRKTKTTDWKKIADTTSTTFTDTTVKPNLTYYYTIRCVNDAGTSYTSYYNKTGKARIFLEVPTPSVKKSGTNVVVKWNAVTGATSYRVYRKTKSGSWVKLNETKNLNYTDSTAKTGVTYYYMVRAVKSGYVSSYKTSNAIRFS